MCHSHSLMMFCLTCQYLHTIAHYDGMEQNKNPATGGREGEHHVSMLRSVPVNSLFFIWSASTEGDEWLWGEAV